MLNKLKRFTIADIRAWNPCYDPGRYLAEDWRGTALDILDDRRISFEDRLWVIMRTDLVSEKLMRLFAVWCARQVQHLMKEESLKALDVAEAFANGQATKEELAAASAAALAAALADASDAASAAAWDAARNAASDAARNAARAAALGAQEVKLREMLLAGIETGDAYAD